MRRIVLRHKMVCGFLDTCNEKLKRAPHDINILRTRGILYSLAEKYNKAISDFIEVLKEFPGDVSSYYLKSDCHYQLGEFEKAKQDFMRAVLLEDNPDIEKKQIENILVPNETTLEEIEKILEYERNKAILSSFPDLAEDTKED